MSCGGNSVQRGCAGYGKQLPQCDPTRLFPSDCGRVPSFYTTTSMQVLCPNTGIFYQDNPSLPHQDTKISSYLPGSIEILTTGYYDITFIVLVTAISSENIASCCGPITAPASCGYPTFAISINGICTATLYSLSSTRGQLYGIGSYFFKQGDIVTIVNASKCPVTIGSAATTPFSSTKTNVVSSCGAGSVSSTIQLLYRGAPSKMN